MFVITADQIDSRHGDDLVDRAIGRLGELGGEALALPVERTAGDELQALTGDAGTVVDLVVALARTGSWSIGLGVGDVEAPLPSSIRAASGPAFFRARDAVEAAKRAPEHVALLVEPGLHRVTSDVEPLLTLALREHGRRDAEDWVVADLLADGLTQREIADRLGVSQQAVSKRIRRQSLATDRAIRDALARLLADADRTETPADRTDTARTDTDRTETPE
jgi:Trp operon repressor